MATNPFSDRNLSMTEPGRDIYEVTPDDDADLPSGYCRALRCTAAGDVVGITIAGNERTIAMTEGEVLDVGFTRIKEATTATVEAIV
jgi:hypothetical protein